MWSLPPLAYVGIGTVTVGLATLIWNIVRNRVVLIISQSGSNVTNQVFTTLGGPAGIMMEVKIINDSLKPVTIRGYELQLLWNDPDWHWLYDPEETGNKYGKYKMPGSFIEFPRDMIVNHRTFKEGMLQPGEVIEGMLMGWGPTPIPKCFPHGSEIEMTLLVYDQRGKPHKSKFAFFVASGPSEMQDHTLSI
jgi:hypothetical protein